MQIRDFSFPTTYSAMTTIRSDCEERTAQLQRAHQKKDWAEIDDILFRGPVDSQARNEVLFDPGLHSLPARWLSIVSSARRHACFPPALDSELLVVAIEMNDFAMMTHQLENGCIQPRALEKAIQTARASNNQNFEEILLRHRPDYKQRMADLQRAHQKRDWAEINDILFRGPVDPQARDAVLFDPSLHNLPARWLSIVNSARRHEHLQPTVDSELLVLAVKKKDFAMTTSQLENGRIQPWAFEKALQIARASGNQNFEEILLRHRQNSN